MKGLERLELAGLRPLRVADAAELHGLIEANRDYLADWLPWAAEQNRAGTRRFLAEAEEQMRKNNGLQAALVPEGRIVGVIGFHAVDWLNRNTTIGYWLAADAQGRGLMTNAVSAFLDLAFLEWDLHRVEIHAAPRNRRSRAVPERLGFREEGRLREAERVGGRFLDGIVYGLLEDEWRSST